MEVSYNLRYQKHNFSNRVLIDKEGEIIIYTKGFRLKGKGATDKGELINFSEIKEFYYRNEKVFFVTFSKEKYILSDAGTLFDQMLIDLYKSRNEFLMEALFMKSGKLKAEFEGNFERLSKFGRPINKGPAKFKLYEKSMVVVPTIPDAFSLNFNFVNFHEFDDLEYNLKLVMDDGMTIFLSHLGNEFEMFEQKVNELLGGMYENLVNEVLKEVIPYFHAGTLLKLAYLMKGGKAVSLKEINKIDKELAKGMTEFIFEDEILKEKVGLLEEMIDEEGIHYSIAKDYAVKGSFIKWILYAIPEKNVVAFSVLPRWDQNSEGHDTYFYKIIMEKGNPADKLEDKIREIDQALVTLNFVQDPCYKNRKELKHSPYQYAIRKMPFLRILRKSYLGKADASEVKDWQNQVKEIFKKAELK